MREGGNPLGLAQAPTLRETKRTLEEENERRPKESQNPTRLMADLLARLQTDLTSARRAQDKPRLLLLGSIVSDVKNREIELKRELTDEDVSDVIRKGIKRRRESLDMYEKGGREDLASIERGEVEALGKYLPAAVDPELIRAAVVAAIQEGATNVGAVMGKVMAQFKGRAEGGTINGIVREELAKRA
jgi:uncharacterized protein YqeY